MTSSTAPQLSVLPPKVKNICGSQFGYLTANTFVRLSPRGAIWSCQCVCGLIKEVPSHDLRSGNTKSCGCKKAELASQKLTKHGQCSGRHPSCYSRAYKAWRSMLNRCYTESSSSYASYGGRGIEVSDQWKNSFERFYQDMGDPPAKYTLERVDVNGGYGKDNCKWVPMEDQPKNKRNTVHVLLNGNKMIQADAARLLGLHPAILCDWNKGRSAKPADIDLVFLQSLTR